MSTHQQRLRFLEWMLDLGLDPDTADAILMTMSPFDWHELATKRDLERFATKADLERFATKADLDELRAETRAEFALVRAEMATKTELNDLGKELRTEMNGGFAQLRQEMDGLRRDVRLTFFAVLGFMLSILLAAGGAAVTLAA